MKALVIATALALAAVPAGAASSKQTSKRDRAHAPQPRFACTVVGCLPVPPGCYPAPGLRFDGTPTGYDVMVCGGGAYTIYGYR